jgi:hypothetical protein
MNRLCLTLTYPKYRFWNTYFIYFYDDHNAVVCILDIRSDEIVDDFRKDND